MRKREKDVCMCVGWQNRVKELGGAQTIRGCVIVWARKRRGPISMSVYWLASSVWQKIMLQGIRYCGRNSHIVPPLSVTFSTLLLITWLPCDYRVTVVCIIAGRWLAWPHCDWFLLVNKLVKLGIATGYLMWIGLVSGRGHNDVCGLLLCEPTATSGLSFCVFE